MKFNKIWVTNLNILFKLFSSTICVRLTTFAPFHLLVRQHPHYNAFKFSLFLLQCYSLSSNSSNVIPNPPTHKTLLRKQSLSLTNAHDDRPHYCISSLRDLFSSSVFPCSRFKSHHARPIHQRR